MYVSSPIPQICLSLVVKFKTKDEQMKCLDLLSELNTSMPETGHESMDGRLRTFLRELAGFDNLVYYTTTFVAHYFLQVNHEELYEMFVDLMEDYSGHAQKITDFNAGYLTGIFSSALMSDKQLNNNIKVPEDIMEAIKYIESENYKVHLEKNVR